MLESLFMEQKHELASLASGWLGFRSRRIEAGLPASSLEVSDNDPMMQTASDKESVPLPVTFHAGLRSSQCQRFGSHMTISGTILVPQVAPGGERSSCGVHGCGEPQLSCRATDGV